MGSNVNFSFLQVFMLLFGYQYYTGITGYLSYFYLHNTGILHI